MPDAGWLFVSGANRTATADMEAYSALDVHARVRVHNSPKSVVDLIEEHGLSGSEDGMAWCIGCSWVTPGGPNVRRDHAIHVARVLGERAT